jgi:spore coat polysaccharide biosynthesis predicted glycosyltransferase SpsG
MILFAVDGGREKGYGHAIRASVLGRACLKRGLEISFVCADQDIYEYLKKMGFQHVRLVDEADLVAGSAYQGLSLFVWDATRPLTEREVEDFHQYKVLVLEFDAPDNRSYADEVVNGFEPTLQSASGRRYKFVGPDYFVIDERFPRAKEWRRASWVPYDRPDLFVCLGGADPKQLLESTLEVLVDIPVCRSIQIHAVAGFDGKRGRAIQQRYSAFKNLRVYTEADASLVTQLMRFSYLGIVSFGTILVEAMAAELPVLMINPTKAHEEYAAKIINGIFFGAGKTFGCAPRIDWDAFRREVSTLLERPYEMGRIQAATRGLVDGQGAQRIAAYIYNATNGSLADENGRLVALER